MSSVSEGGDTPACANTWKVEWKVLIETKIEEVKETEGGDGDPNWKTKI